MKVTYSCIQNMSKIYKGHNSKITSTPCNQLTLCNCRIKGECPMDDKCQIIDTVYDCRVTSPEPRKLFFRLAEGKWKPSIITIKSHSITNDIQIRRLFQVMCGI